MAWLDLGKLMDQRKMSMYELSKRLGLPPNSVLAYFKPGADPKFSTVLRWAEALECDVQDLINSKLNTEIKTMPRPKKYGPSPKNKKSRR